MAVERAVGGKVEGTEPAASEAAPAGGGTDLAAVAVATAEASEVVVTLGEVMVEVEI